MWFRSDESLNARWQSLMDANAGPGRRHKLADSQARTSSTAVLTAAAVLQVLALMAGMLIIEGHWYPGLSLPFWALPQPALMAAWTLLILCTGVAVLGVHRVSTGEQVEADAVAARRRALLLINAQLLLCGAWLLSFFVGHGLGASFALSCSLWLLTVVSVAAFMNLRPAAGWLLAPQLLWFSYLLVLSGVIWLSQAPA